MKYDLRSLLLIAGILLSVVSMAQDSLPVKFSYEKQRLNDQEVLLVLKATMKPGVKLFSIREQAEDGAFSSITFDSTGLKYSRDSILEEGRLNTEFNAVFEKKVLYYQDSVKWVQKVLVSSADSVVIKGTIGLLYQTGDQYLSGEEPFKFFIQRADSGVHPGTASSGDAISDQSLWWIFLAAFGGGLLALLTPCVYSMIPVTVSFFTKRSKSRKEGISNALWYALSIVLIFTLLGFLITLTFGPAALNNLATNWVANLLFFVLFIIFGISFLGAFEIRLPSAWTNKSDSKASSSSVVGIFFMALTLVLVSFSCTGPIIGNLLVLAAKGSVMGPLVGMLGFSMALALPFALFAFFPSKLNVLGKAGGWLNSVKVTLGFLELALALKFLSNADLAKGWRLLDREVFICCWVVIFVLLGIYLLGKLKLHHDSELPANDFGMPYLTVTRLFFAMSSLIFALYMVPGLWGAPLKAISAFVPPMGTQDFVSNSNSHQLSEIRGNAVDKGLPHPVKYYDVMKKYEPQVVTSYGLTTYFDYDEALAVARKLHKPLMLDFTGINCVNCRKMEGQVWSDPAVMKRLKDEFVIASLYVDVQQIDLQEQEQYVSTSLGKKVETLGDKNADLQVSRFGSNSQPYYFFLDANEQKIVADGYGYNPSVEKFINLLDVVILNYKNKK